MSHVACPPPKKANFEPVIFLVGAPRKQHLGVRSQVRRQRDNIGSIIQQVTCGQLKLDPLGTVGHSKKYEPQGYLPQLNINPLFP